MPVIPAVYKYIGAAVLAAIILATIAMLIKSHEHRQQYIDNQFTQKGAVTERAQAQSEVINAVQNAQDVVRNPTANQLDSVCAHYDRNCPHRS